jgi:hypothetical protein
LPAFSFERCHDGRERSGSTPEIETPQKCFVIEKGRLEKGFWKVDALFWGFLPPGWLAGGSSSQPIQAEIGRQYMSFIAVALMDWNNKR